MLSERVALAHQGIEAFNSGDLDTMFEMVAREIEAYVPEGLPTQGSYHGPEGFARLIAQWGEAWESFEILPEEYIERGEHVIVPFVGRGRGRHSGAVLESHYTLVLGIRDRKLTSWRLYVDMDEALAAAGLA